MDEVAWARDSALLQASNQSCGSADVVAVGAVEHNVSLGGFCSEQLGVIQVAIDQANLGILRCYLCTFIGAADKCCDLKIRVGVGYSIESITANVASSASAISLSVAACTRYGRSSSHK